MEQIYEIPNGYEEDKSLRECNIIHLWPREETGGKGLHDARFFQVVLFNTATMKYNIMNSLSDIIWSGELCQPQHMAIKKIYIYKDGATLIEFSRMIEFPKHGMSAYFIS